MVVDTRTLYEREHGYPPSPATMARRCTATICGKPDTWLFDQVHDELITYLNRPGLKVEDLFRDVLDASGSFTEPSLHDADHGNFLRHFGLYQNEEAAQALIDAHPADFADVIRVPAIGPDTFYDLWRMTLVRWIRAQGGTLIVFTWGNGEGVDRLYFAISPYGSTGTPQFVRTRNGLPYDVDTGALFVVPDVGTYDVRCAWPSPEFAEEAVTYKSNELTAGSSAALARLVPGRALVRLGVSAAMLRIHYDEGIDRLSIATTRPQFPRMGVDGERIDAAGVLCTMGGDCDDFSWVDHESLEGTVRRRITTDPNRHMVMIPDLPGGTYTVAGYAKEAGIIVATTRDVVVGPDQVLEIGLDHGFDISRLDAPPPRKAFLQGDFIRQAQGETNWCGPFSLAHAFSYWAPQAFNPKKRNGSWMGNNVQDGWDTWAHVAVMLAFPIPSAIAAAFIDDPSPGTLQETLVRGCRIFGFSGQPYQYDGISQDEALGHLKQWISAGVPVLVAVDEYMDHGAGHWTTEHFKVLIGFDDDAVLHYTDDNGVEQENIGAFYFINSGGMGEDRDPPTDVSAQYRENHGDYNNVPIGNDTDAYEIFWKKWEAGSIPSFSKNFWCLPIYPVVWERVPRPEEPA